MTKIILQDVLIALRGAYCARAGCLCLLLLCVPVFCAHAFNVNTDMEAQLIKGSSTRWQVVNRDNTYASVVPVCIYLLPTFKGNGHGYTALPVIARIRNTDISSVEIKIQVLGSSVATTGDAHCLSGNSTLTEFLVAGSIFGRDSNSVSDLSATGLASKFSRPASVFLQISVFRRQV